MIKHILNSILAWLFSLLKRQKVDYPKELHNKTRDEFIKKISKK